MTPYYSEAGITIYHGDCREVLPTLTADCVLTDMPYAIGAGYDAYIDTENNLDELIEETLPLMRQAAPAVALTCGIGNWWRYPRPTWVLAWCVSAGASTGFWGFNEWQPILVYGKDPYLVRGLGRRSDTLRLGVPTADLVLLRTTEHPCPKPLRAWQGILKRVSPHETDTIIDPFMGTGTTLLAAKNSGRRAVGVDLSERYCEIAAKRLAQTVMFGAESVA